MKRRTFLKSAAAVPLALTMSAPTLTSALSPEIHRPKMQTRRVAGAGILLPVIGFGTWQTFDVDPANMREMMRLAEVLRVLRRHGGRVIDTSPMYGHAEDMLGRLWKERELDRRVFFLATKVWTRGKDEGIQSMAASARKMKAGSHLDLMQIHNLVDWRTHLKTLRAMKERGEIRHIGLTHYTDAGVDEMVEILRAEKGIDFVQCPYSLGVRKSAETLIPLCAAKGIGVIVNRPFEGGAAFRSTRGKTVPSWAKDELGIESWAQFFLKFVLGNPAVSCVIPGTGKVEHAHDNVKAGMGAMPTEAQQKRMIAHWNEIR